MTLEEARVAYRIGVRRSEAARARAGIHRFGWTPAPRDQRHVDGMSAVSEFAVALAIGRSWISDGLEPDAPRAGDVDGGISVRWTPLERGSLIVHEDEPAELRAVLVVGPRPPLRIAGWLPVVEAQRSEYWRVAGVRHPAYFVPQAALRPIAELAGV